MVYNIGVLLVSFFSLFSQSLSSSARLVPAMYVFGDSLVDAGNNNYLVFSLLKANFPHNGIDFPTKKPTGRFCNGKNAVDLLSEIVGLPPFPPYLSVAFKLKKSHNQFLTGANFASGGSGIMNQTNKMFSLSLTKQVGYFVAVHKALNKQLGPTGATKGGFGIAADFRLIAFSCAEGRSCCYKNPLSHFSKSLFLIVTGSNDIFSYFGSDELRNKSTPLQYVNLMSFTLKGQVKRLYNLGARKFVFIGTGLIGCIPSVRNKNKGEQCNEEVNHWSVKYNEALRLMLRNLKFELNGINYSYFDGYSVMQNFIQKPAAYGFSEVKAACCGMGKLKAEIPCLPIASYCNNRSNHLFWDGSHPTEAAHRIFVDHIFYGPLQYTFPVNVKKLIAI